MCCWPSPGLYLPQEWCEDEVRRARAQVPADVEFATKTELGTQMITGAIGRDVRFGWAVADEVYGRSAKLRQACEDAGKGYVLAVPRDFRVRLHPQRGKMRADMAGRGVPAASWETRSCGKGCKGRRDYAWAQSGITLVRDVGSAGGLTLQLRPGPGMPVLQAAPGPTFLAAV